MIVTRSHNAPELEKTMEPFLPLEGFTPSEWLRNRNNIALTDGEGSYALFEYTYEGAYYGHYFFKLRGKDAISFSKKCLKEIFTNLDAHIIIGLTPCDNKAALWMNRQLGFKYRDTIDSREGPTQIFILTKQEWEEANG